MTKTEIRCQKTCHPLKAHYVLHIVHSSGYIPNSQPHLPPIPGDGLHQFIGFSLQIHQLPVNLPHPLSKIYPVVRCRGYAHISAGSQRPALFLNICQTCRPAQPQNVPVLVLSKLLVEPDGLFRGGQGLIQYRQPFVVTKSQLDISTTINVPDNVTLS